MSAVRAIMLAIVLSLALATRAAGSSPLPANGLLAFTSLEQGLQIFSMTLSGTGARRVSASPAIEYHGVLSPDRSTIAFVSGRSGYGDLYVANVDGTGARRLTNDPAWEGDPDWSPDSRRIVFEGYRDDDDGDIFVISADGTGLTKLAASSDEDRNPAWSPDGARIAFDSDRDGDREIFAMNTDGTGVTQLTATRSVDDDRLPEWSPDGTKIVFSSDRGTQIDDEIWIMNTDGAEATQLTSNKYEDWWPDWSPDGSTIVFTSDRDDEDEENGEVYVMDVTGAGQTNVSRNDADDFGGLWGADGRLYFTSDRNANTELGVVAWDGSARRTLAPSAAVDYMPAWSPDGKRVAFTSYIDNDDAEIYIAPAARGRVSQVTDNDVADRDPTWSPSGRRIAFVRTPIDEDPELWLADTDGRKEERLLRAATVQHLEWSPNGRWIALSLNGDIAVVPSSGGHPRLIAWNGSNYHPTWSPDGTQLAFSTSSRTDEDDSEIYVVPFGGGRTRRVTHDDLDHVSLDWSPDGRWIAFALDAYDDDSSIYVVRPNGTGTRRIPLPTPAGEPAWQPLP